MQLGVQDAFHLGEFYRHSDKAFTWTNAHNDDTMIQSCIDRIYIPTWIEHIGGTTRILPTLPDVSDHAGVVLHFNDEPRKKPSTPFFNKWLLANPDSKVALHTTSKGVMEDETLDSWNKKMIATNKAIHLKSKELTKNQKKKWKETYLAQFEDIIAAEAELQQNWGSKEAHNRLNNAHATIHEVRQQKFQFQENAILSQWARVGARSMY